MVRAPTQGGPGVYGVRFPDGTLMDINRMHPGIRRESAKALPTDDTDYFPLSSTAAS